MKSKTILYAITLLQLLIIGLLFFYIYSNGLLVKPNYINIIGDKIRVYTPLPTLENFYEPPTNTTVTIPNVDFPGLGTSTYSFNSDSLHELRDYSIKKASSTFRIITLGDSFTFGLYLNTKDNYTEQLESTLNSQCTAYENYEVLNLAEAGYDIQYALERYRIRGLKYNPDLVTWLFSDSDFAINLNKIEKINQEYQAKAILNAQKKGLPRTTQMDQEAWNHALKTLRSTTELDDHIHQGIEYLYKIRDLYSGPLVLITQPHTFELNTNKKFPEFNSFFSSPDVHYINTIGDIFNPQYTVSSKDAHPNKLGSEHIAQDLFDYLISNNIVPCN